MQWSDQGIVLSVRRLGENSGVVHLLTPEHGLHAGVDKSAFSSRRRGTYQPGNVVSAHWQARLSEHIGMLSCELIEANAAQLLDNRGKLASLTSAVMLTEKMLAERDSQPEVYEGLACLIHTLCREGDWLAEYVRFELLLLACSGFGLDLSQCAATGQEHDLMYVSPKSGRAVSRHAGEPYHERLFLLPPFLIIRHGPEGVPMPQILDGLRLCGYFIHQRVFAPRGITVPAARHRFVESVGEGSGKTNDEYQTIEAVAQSYHVLPLKMGKMKAPNPRRIHAGSRP